VYICEKASGVSSVAAYDLIFPGVYTVSSGSTTNKKLLAGVHCIEAGGAIFQPLWLRPEAARLTFDEEAAA
jgi:hypothetical protein